MNPKSKLLLASALAALAANVSVANVEAGAQVNAAVNNATNATQNAVNSAQAGVNNAAQNATNAANHAVGTATQAGANATQAATGAVRDTTAGVGATVNSSVTGNVDATRRDGLSVDGQLNNSANAGANINGRGLAAGVTQNLAASVSTAQVAQVARDIRGTAFDARTQLVAALDTRVSQTKEGTAAVVNRLNAEAREQARAAVKRADKAHDRLADSIERAREAKENKWDSARERLADDYEAYAKATAELVVSKHDSGSGDKSNTGASSTSDSSASASNTNASR